MSPIRRELSSVHLIKHPFIGVTTDTCFEITVKKLIGTLLTLKTCLHRKFSLTGNNLQKRKTKKVQYPTQN